MLASRRSRPLARAFVVACVCSLPLSSFALSLQARIPSGTSPVAFVPPLQDAPFRVVLAGMARVAMDEPVDALALEAAVFSGGRKGSRRLAWSGFGGPPFAWSTAIETACPRSADCRGGGVFDAVSRRRGLAWTAGGGPVASLGDTRFLAAGRGLALGVEYTLGGTIAGYFPEETLAGQELTAGAVTSLAVSLDVERGPSLRLTGSALVFREASVGAAWHYFVGAAIGWP